MSQVISFTLEESKAGIRAVFQALIQAPVEMVAPGRIINPDGNPYRFSDRLHSTSKDKSAIDDVAAQVEELSVLNPLIVVDEGLNDGSLIIASGLKRLKAVHNLSSDTPVPVKRIVLSDIFAGIDANWSSEKKKACLAEALQHVVYTESETNSKLSDESVVSLLRTIKSNQQVESFREVMPRLGLKRDNSIYRDIKRLWGVVADDQLYQSFLEGVIPLEVAKKDLTQKVFEQAGKRDELLEKVKDYRRRLVDNVPDNAAKSRIEDMKGYSKFEIELLVRDVAQKDAEEEETFTNPVFDIEAKDGYVTVPKIEKLSVSDVSRQNVAKVLDIYYNLSMLCEQLKGYLDAAKPDEVGGQIKKERSAAFSVKSPEYGEHYIDFLDKQNMHFYAKASAIEAHHETIREILLDLRERDALKKSERPARIIEKFIERIKSKRS